MRTYYLFYPTAELVAFLGTQLSGNIQLAWRAFLARPIINVTSEKKESIYTIV